MKYGLRKFFTFLVMTQALYAGLVVDITKGTISEIPIALTELFVENKSFIGRSPEEEIARNIEEVVHKDLTESGLFRAIDPHAFIQTDFSDGVRFSDWRVINAQVLVTGDVKLVDSENFVITFNVYDIFSQERLTHTHFNAKTSDWRRVAHKVADVIYERVTGEKGYFDTRIVYVSQGQSRNGKRHTRLAIMDQDGANHQYLSSADQLLLTPRFSPTLHHIIYLDFGEDWKTPRVYIMDTFTGKKKRLGEFKGMTFAPRFAPDGETVVMSYSREGISCLYSMNIQSGESNQLTYGTSIDVSGCYSPKGDEIVFNSDRSGSQQLYVMSATGHNLRRISFGEGQYASPVWSPRGDLIAFNKFHNGKFYIGVMRPDGSAERLITSGYLVEEPSWAPNGRVLLYSKKTSESDPSKIYRIDLTGYNDRQIVTPGPEEAISAAWSPLLP